MNVLHQVCSNWFKTRPLIPAFGVDFPKKKMADVVLISRFYEQLMGSDQWPLAGCRLWVVCQAAKAVLVNEAGIPSHKVGVVPRYQLIPRAKEESPFPNMKKPWSLVYSGRMTEDKGFLFFLKVAHLLQQKFKLPVTPVIFGIKELPNPETARFNKKVRKLLSELEWKIPPSIWTNLAPGEWTQVKLTHPVLFNFTWYAKDDFGVSVSEAQQEGWPVLLSAWAGNLDVRGKSVRHFELAYRKNVEKLCQEMIRRMTSAEKVPNEILPGRTPDSLSAGELKLIRRRLAKMGALNTQKHFSAQHELLLDQHRIPWRVQDEALIAGLETEFRDVAKQIQKRHREILRARPEDVTLKLRRNWLGKKISEEVEIERQRKYLQVLRWAASKELGPGNLKLLQRKITGNDEFRTRASFIKTVNGKVTEHFPSFEVVPSLVRAYEAIEEQQIEGIRKGIIRHLVLLSIHPFLDGNGRVARLLETSALEAEGIQFLPAWNSEAMVHWDCPSYYRALTESRQAGYADAYLVFSLRSFISIGKGLISSLG